MTPYAERAEQARTRCKVIREQLSTLFKMAEGGLTLEIISDTNNAKERLRLASDLADCLDTLARVEAAINDNWHAATWNDCRTAVLKAMIDAATGGESDG